MRTPTKALVLFVLIALVLALCAGCRKISEQPADTGTGDLENTSDLGVVGSDELVGDTEDDATGAAVEEIEVIPAAQPEGAAASEAATAVSAASQIVVREGQLVELKPKGYDPDGDPITYTFSPPLDTNGKWQTKVGDKGTYKAQVTASDGKTKSTQDMEIVVKEVNKAPMLEALSDISVVAGDNVIISPKASDANNDALTFSYTGWMTSSEKATAEADVGSHDVTVIVSDGEMKDSATIKVTVSPKNSAPVMEKIKDITVKEGETVSFEPKVVDPDGDKVEISYSGWMSSPTYTTDYDDSGDYTVTITASDGKLQTTQNVKVTVLDENRPVVFNIEAVVN